jgi:hypothetical protein
MWSSQPIVEVRRDVGNLLRWSTVDPVESADFLIVPSTLPHVICNRNTETVPLFDCSETSVPWRFLLPLWQPFSLLGGEKPFIRAKHRTTQYYVVGPSQSLHRRPRPWCNRNQYSPLWTIRIFDKRPSPFLVIYTGTAPRRLA